MRMRSNIGGLRGVRTLKEYIRVNFTRWSR